VASAGTAGDTADGVEGRRPPLSGRCSRAGRLVPGAGDRACLARRARRGGGRASWGRPRRGRWTASSRTAPSIGSSCGTPRSRAGPGQARAEANRGPEDRPRPGPPAPRLPESQADRRQPPRPARFGLDRPSAGRTPASSPSDGTRGRGATPGTVRRHCTERSRADSTTQMSPANPSARDRRSGIEPEQLDRR
jgi:hypothetical protein